jgi:hypothetical protein
VQSVPRTTRNRSVNERLRLRIVHENEVPVLAERIDGLRELGFPVDVAILRDLEAVERALGVGGLHETTEQPARASAAEVVRNQ